MGASRSKEAKVIMLGPDNAGKTTILNTLSSGNSYEVAPTHGFNVQALTSGDLTMRIHDIGGQKSSWRLWPTFFDNAEIIIFVMDSSDRARLHEVAAALKLLLSSGDLAGIPMLLWANKQDLLNSMTTTEIVQALDLQLIKDRSFQVVGCSARTLEGLSEGIDWISGVHLGTSNK